MAKVEIFTQPGCPYCIRAVGLLKQKDIPFTEVDAPRGTKAREEAIERSGGKRTVPQIFINGTSIGGCDELLALERNGKLDELLKGA
ncbi:glutaredoxin 3 [Oecophyllibacter saccharovorans]|uniref:Glutaredoxin n=1 Tax=Oecophyllibacter saccharovorans TaxID=2558360 RepID=A0A506US54_9PROT|nr:glutaredoxin 3 [Oecophyllibacter saccharovorans]QDH15896.1 glutaredoxin 3 [Oecophyllibacter saccharovorans]TPW35327.1 glutaredoxin 3 [Oecophyllibacter saccharovorans]TPW36168.1 glutaredoxin 3 [Oecophyllibacter saccharovorans]